MYSYSIHDLAQQSSFEETLPVAHGELPTQSQLDTLDGELKAARELPGPILDIILLVKDAHPMEVLRTATSALGAFDPEVGDNSAEATTEKASVNVSSAEHRLRLSGYRNEREVIAPSTTLGHAANFLYMLSGEEPSADSGASLMDTDMVLHAEHGSNASSFTARVVTGTDANLHGSIIVAIAALSGPRMVVLPNVMKMAQEVGEPLTLGYVKAKRES